MTGRLVDIGTFFLLLCCTEKVEQLGVEWRSGNSSGMYLYKISVRVGLNLSRTAM